METERDDDWLAERVRLLWENHFRDVPVGLPIVTRFGSRAKYRFGSIAARDGKCLILINRLFADPFVPTFVVDGTLAHELAHYAHGFGSGLPRLHEHAHKGGVVDRELEKRGLGDMERKAEQWRKACWETFYAERCGDLTARHAARAEFHADRWETFLSRSECRTEAELQTRLTALRLRLGDGGDTPAPFAAVWLHATAKQAGLSYWFKSDRTVRIHGLLADRRVPAAVLDFELIYWLARLKAGRNWQTILATLRAAGLESTMEAALRWRRHAWTTFRRRHHP